MASKSSSSLSMRVLHRYLGFFLAGIMAVYAISGMLMVFRNTDFLKETKHIEKTLAPNLSAEAVGKEIRKKNLKEDKIEDGIMYFKDGTYVIATGSVAYETKELPFILGKMEKMHKATTDSPLYFLNLFFGASLLFFVISTFWMFRPNTNIFKKGLIFTLVGIVLTLIMVFI
jgi:hypothetical protein